MRCKTLFLGVIFILFSTLLWANEKEGLAVGLPKDVNTYSIEKLERLASEYYYEDLNLAVQYAKVALNKAKKEGDNKRVSFIYRKIGSFYENNNMLDTAIVFYKKELFYAQEASENINVIAAYTDLAISYRRKANYKLCKDYHLKALALAKLEEDSNSLETTYHGLGTLYKDIGDYETAVKYYLQAIELTEKRGDFKNVINSKQYIANTYAESGNMQLALSTIREASEMALKQQDSILIGIVLFDYAKILGTNLQYEEALEKHQSAIKIFKKAQHKPLIARSLLYLADTYSQKGMYERAGDYFTQCLEYEAFMSLKTFVDLNYKIGNLYLKRKQLDKAEEAFHKSFALAKESGIKEFSQKNNYSLYEVYNEKQEYEKALNYLKAAIKVKESLASEGKAKKIAELQFKYDVEKSEREIQALQLRQNKLFLIGSSILFSLLVMFLTFIIQIRGKNNRKLKLKNDEIQQQNIKLRESNEVLQQFTYVAAHDLKEPLRSIGSFVNLLQKKYGKNFNEEANEYMAFVTNSVKRMDNLLTALLEYSTISIQKPSNDSIDTRAVLQDVLYNLQDTIDTKKAQIEFPAELPKLKMSKLHITQLFQNLISNGMKFTNGIPTIKIDAFQEEGMTTFTIADNGIGMKEEYAHKVYNLFHQLNKNSNYKGTGIGLTICKNIVDKYNGKIWFESAEGKGTKFFLQFPNA